MFEKVIRIIRFEADHKIEPKRKPGEIKLGEIKLGRLNQLSGIVPISLPFRSKTQLRVL